MLHEPLVNASTSAMLKPLLDLLFPIPSLDGGEGQWVTEEEWASITKLESIYITKSELQKMGCNDIDAVIAAADYRSSPLLRKAIRTLKYKRIPALADILAYTMIEAASEMLTLDANHSVTLCPIPLHWTRQFQRGFNQAHVLAENISREKSWPVEQILIRRKPTGHQAWRKREERLQAMKNVFCINTKVPVADTVILVDDLLTTGATMQACAAECKKAGATRVLGLTIARG